MTSGRDAAEAERRFAAFLERHHESGADLEELCAACPQWATTFRRWWRALAETGEVVECSRAESVLGGRYVVERELGRGSQGSVVLAWDRVGDRRVAIKRLHPGRSLSREAVRRFAREAEAAGRLEHPGVCGVLDAGEEEDGRPYLVMPYVEGETLARRFERARRAGEPMAMGIEEALAFFEKAARALDAAHRRGLVHRDVKPGNLMVTAEGDPVLLDFGLARELDGDEGLTRTGEVVGTPAYMAPELLSAERVRPDARCDVYSLGATLFECLTLRRPFEAPTQEALFRAVLTGSLPDPRTWNRAISPDLALVLRTALQRDPENRYASAGYLAEDLRRLRLGESVVARPVPAWRRLRGWARARPALAASLAGLALTLVVGSAVSLGLWLRARAVQRDYEQLADQVRVDQALAAERKLLPPCPERIGELRAWLERTAAPLLARAPEHRARLAALRAQADRVRGLGATDAAGAKPLRERVARLRRRLAHEQRGLETARGELARLYWRMSVGRTRRELDVAEAAVSSYAEYEFLAADRQFLHDALARLVRSLGELERAREAVRARLALCEDMARLARTEHAAAWAAARRHVRSSPRYGGLELPVQTGLVPLGVSPQGLAEFAVMGTGEPPARGEDGELRIDETSAVVLVLVPGGTFWMGAQNHDPDAPGYDPAARAFDGPPQRVRLDPYFVGKYELSRAQWVRLSGGERPVAEELAEGLESDDDHPVSLVSWTHAREVLARWGLSLPTEAQWEYAARGGATTPYWTGAEPYSLAGAANLRDRSWRRRRLPGGPVAPYDDGFATTAPIDALRPNGYGLHHVHGNVAEYCFESFLPFGRGTAAPRPGDGLRDLSEAPRRVLRGGSFASRAVEVRLGARAGRAPDEARPDAGVRPVRALER